MIEFVGKHILRRPLKRPTEEHHHVVGDFPAQIHHMFGEVKISDTPGDRDLKRTELFLDRTYATNHLIC